MYTLDNAVEYAAGELPEGWGIEIYVENGSAWVRLESPFGEGVEVDTSDLTLGEAVVAAVKRAKR